jgi:hypothetical protein
MTHTSIKLKILPLTLSGLIATACLTIPLTALADTSTSIDAIMEQMKSLQTSTPKVSTPEPEKIESKVEEKKAEEPIKIKKKPVEDVKSSIYVAPQEIEKQQTFSSFNAIEQVSTPKTSKKRRKSKKIKKSKKKRIRRQISNKGGAVDYKGFDERYMSLINDILNGKEPASSPVPNPVSAQATQGGNFTGTSGWIYLGKYSRGRWLASKSLKLGNNLPVAGRQYTVKSPMLNMRETRPLKTGLGKLLQVLHIGDRVQVNRVHRFANNNYWANIVLP